MGPVRPYARKSLLGYFFAVDAWNNLEVKAGQGSGQLHRIQFVASRRYVEDEDLAELNSNRPVNHRFSSQIASTVRTPSELL